MRKATVTIAASATLLCAGMAHAAATAEEKCQAERAKAAGAYALCQQQAQAKLQTTGFDFTKFETAASKCRVTYTGTWAKLQAKGALFGSSCIGARFTDGGTTVTDNLTGLQWEKKTSLDSTTNFADRHDADNLYTWCIDGNSDFFCDNGGAADSTAFTDFLRSLNSGGCFAGQCDWRLPTRDELQTILADPFTGSACTTPSCIDAIFGSTQSSSTGRLLPTPAIRTPRGSWTSPAGTWTTTTSPTATTYVLYVAACDRLFDHSFIDHLI